VTELTPARAAELYDVLTAACALINADASGAELLKYTNNAVYRLRADPVVVRIGIGDIGARRAPRVIAAARWLAERDAPVVRLLDIAQPVHVDGYAATFWHALPDPTGTVWSGADLAVPLLAVHRLPTHPALPEWDPFTPARQRLDAADGLDPDDLAWLREQWAQAEQQYRKARAEFRLGVLHGDAHTGNLLRTPDGRVVLCDLDSTGQGTVAWDLVPTAVGATRFGNRARHVEFAAAYGQDVTNTAEWPTLRRIRELGLVTSVVPELRRRPDVAAEHAHRLKSLRAGHNETLWRRYS